MDFVEKKRFSTITSSNQKENKYSKLQGKNIKENNYNYNSINNNNIYNPKFINFTSKKTNTLSTNYTYGTRKTINTINNSNFQSLNNKYNTINSNSNVNNIAKTNPKSNKFESRVLDHFNNVKNKNPNPNTKFNNLNKKYNKLTIANKKLEKETKNFNTEFTQKIKLNSNTNSNTNLNTLNIQKLDINKDNKLRTSLNNNKYNSNMPKNINLKKYRSDNMTKKIDIYAFNSEKSKENLNKDENSKMEKLEFLMSDNFKSSLDISLQKEKSFQNSISKVNKTTKKINIFLDLDSQETKREVSVGERLYRKSVAFKDLKEKNCLMELNRKEKEEIKNCSFCPKISNESASMNIKVK